MNREQHEACRRLAHRLLDRWFDQAPSDHLHGHFTVEVHCHAGLAVTVKEKLDLVHRP